MPQSAQQSPTQPKRHHNAGRPWGTPFRSGVDSKAEREAIRRAQIGAKARELAEGLGVELDRMSGLNREYLLQAADLLTRKARTVEDATRALNTARGLVASVERRERRREAAGGESFATLLEDGQA
jgi:hypothetical protein